MTVGRHRGAQKEFLLAERPGRMPAECHRPWEAPRLQLAARWAPEQDCPWSCGGGGGFLGPSPPDPSQHNGVCTTEGSDFNFFISKIGIKICTW